MGMRGLRTASFAVFKAPAHLIPAGAVSALENFEDPALRFWRESRPRHYSCQLSLYGFAVNDLAGFADALSQHGGQIS